MREFYRLKSLKVNSLKAEDGFNLLEVLLALTLLIVIFMAVASLNTTAWKYWEKNQEKIDLKQQARMIAKFLDRDIKLAVAVKTDDLDEDEKNQLYLNLGDNQIEGDKTDSTTDYYLKYLVSSRRLIIKKTGGAFNNSGTCYPDWPSPDDWGVSRSITMGIIQDYSLVYDRDSTLVNYFFELEENGERYRLEGKIHPRLLK